MLTYRRSSTTAPLPNHGEFFAAVAVTAAAWQCYWTGRDDAVILLAEVSGLSEAETERIWLPFIVWVPARRIGAMHRFMSRRWLAVQAGTALAANHLVPTFGRSSVTGTETGRVLVVDDDETVRDVVRRYLEASGFTVEVAGDGTEGMRSFERLRPDLVVLDLTMPGINGLEVCRRMRQSSQVPVVLLTALGEEEDRIAGLRLGADDYVTKPFSPRELALRAVSVLRRARMPREEPTVSELADGDLRLHLGARQSTLERIELSLTAREFDLLAFFLNHPRVAFSRADLPAKVRGWGFGDQSTVTVHVRRLWEKIEADPAKPVRVAAVWGVGYRYDQVRL